MEHHFNVEIAAEIGIDKAIFLHNIEFWIKKNEANDRHFYDGRYWTYNSVKAFAVLFPYWNGTKIKRMIASLKEEGYLEVGNYNQSSYDRTSWYALTERSSALVQNDQMESSKVTQPIPDSKPDSKPSNVKEHLKLTFAHQVIEAFTKITGKAAKLTTQRQTSIGARIKDGNGLAQFEAVFKYKFQEWKDDPEMKKFIRLETLLAPSHFQNYLEEAREHFKPERKPATKSDSVDNEYT